MDNQNFNNSSNMTLQNVKTRKPISDLYFSNGDFQNAEVFYPSKMNEFKEPDTKNLVRAFLISDSNNLRENNISSNYQSNPFILANTLEVPLHHLKNDCIIPVFSKDNEKTIAHQEFIECVITATQKAFPYQTISEPQIRVSHQIKGRTPEAIHLNVKDLLEHQKTIYYERMAFIIRIPSITDVVNGNDLSLCIGGVRSYNLEKSPFVSPLARSKLE